MTPNDFIKMMVQSAQSVQQQTNIPASFTIAQGALESAWNTSFLSQRAFNFFGIKADSSWKGDVISMPTHEIVNGQRILIQANFRKYANLTDGLQDHADFLTGNPRYGAINGKFDLIDSCEFAKNIQAAGYATDLTYSDKIIEIINFHNLKQYDVV